nr:RNA polymerase sigma factor [Sphingomonas sanxanigenens]
MSRQRAAWLGERIFPHEAALRAWLARRPLTSAMDIDDVVQESYAILAGLESVEHIRNPRTYLFEVAKSVVLQALRRSNVVTIDALAEAEALQVPANEPSPEMIAADRQELGRLATLIGGLPPRCREAFTLRKIHGLSQREVAEQLGLSQSTVEKHIIKALSILTGAIGRGGKRSIESSTPRDHDDPIQPGRAEGERRRH